MSSFINFDATQVDPTPKSDFDTLPAGPYQVIITDSEIKQTKDGSGSYLNITLEVQSGEFQGRKIWEMIMLQSDKQNAVASGQRMLSQICHAVNVLQVKDSADLHYKPLIAVLRIEKDKTGNYPDRNRVHHFEADNMQSSNIGFTPPAGNKQSAQNKPMPWSAR